MHNMHKHVIEDELRKVYRCITDRVIHKHHMEKFCAWFRDLVRMNARLIIHGCICEVK